MPRDRASALLWQGYPQFLKIRDGGRIVKSSLVWIVALGMSASLFTASPASAQAPDSRWNAEASVGWDINLSGDLLAAGIGTLQGVPVVFQSQSFGDVYGNGVQWSFGAGYMLDDVNEVRGQFSYQRAGSDAVTLGTAGSSTLMATFADYKASSFEAGYRRYFAPRAEKLRPYAGGLLGVSIIPEIDGVFAAPEAGLARYATDLYDGTAALTLGFNGGALYEINERFDLNGQLTFRYNSGLSKIDALQGTGLENTNDKSSRWSMPITFGLRVKF
jgi:long-subunit fatty acid transport protein